MILQYRQDEIEFANASARKYGRHFIRMSVTPEEWLFLYHITVKEKPKQILEIGSYKYTSSVAFLTAMSEHKDIYLTSLDLVHHKFSVDSDLKRRWNRIKGDSQTIMNKIHTKFDLVFIDGWHDLASCSSDFRNSLRLLNKGGTIIFHDTRHPEVADAIKRVAPSGSDIKWYANRDNTTKWKDIAVYRSK